MTAADDQPSPAAESLRLACRVARDELVDVLARRSFRQVPDRDGTWRGLLDTTSVAAATHASEGPSVTLVEIVIPDEYPFAAPRVVPVERGIAEATLGRSLPNYHQATRSWHRELDGAMCLFLEADHTRLPWADGDVLLEQATAWLAQDAASWPGHDPALDVDRYLRGSAETRVLLVGEREWTAGEFVRLRPEGAHLLLVAGLAGPGRTGRKGGRRRWAPEAALVVDVGDLAQPITNWDALLEALGTEQSERLVRGHADGLRRAIVLYRRNAAPGLLAVDWRPTAGGGIELRRIATAPDDRATRLLRAHSEADRLAHLRVVVVGVGAIGSVVADLLHRSGLGELHLIDPDIVLPGNTTRHLLGDAYVGQPKSTAVAAALRTARPTTTARVAGQFLDVRTISEAVGLLSTFDLVIDATADSAASALLAAAARSGAGQLLAVCVLANGYAIRVDRVPPAPDATAMPATPLPEPSVDVYEVGCASPVSSTPPAAVWEAAAMASRHAVQLLLHPEIAPSGEVRILRTMPEETL